MTRQNIPPGPKFIPDIDIANHEGSMDLKIQNYPQRGIDPSRVPLHYHHNVELNFVERGSVSYLHCNRIQHIACGQLGVFWAGYPHKILVADPELSLWWITVPLPQFIGWKLSSTFTRRLMQGEILFSTDPQPELDVALLQRWAKDYQEADCRDILLLEIEARTRRIERRLSPPQHTALHPEDPHLDSLHPAALRMAAKVISDFDQPIHLEEVCAQVKLNPSYGARLFKKNFGCTLGQFLQEVRVSHAIHLLQHRDDSVLDIAFASGFQSASRFYAAFKQVTGKQPKDYRSLPR